MKIIKNKKKLFDFSYVMGRFSKKIGKNFQYFPIHNWQRELVIAKKFKFDGVEWIISDYSNPLFNSVYLKEIKKKLNNNKLKICSIALDFIMSDPLHLISITNLKWIVDRIILIQKKINVGRITIPIEENARFTGHVEKKITLQKLEFILTRLGKKSKICIETDIPPNNLTKLLGEKKYKELGILVDLGNVRANGFDLNDYIDNFPDRIYGIHVKYRDVNYGESKNIPKKFKELSVLKNRIKSLNNLKDITFQTYRSEKNYVNDMKNSIKNFNGIFYK